MEPTETAAYGFPDTALGCIPRRVSSGLATAAAYPFYGPQTGAYSLPFQPSAPLSATYSFAFSLNHQAPYQQHQHLFVTSQQPSIQQPNVHMSSGSSQLLSIPDVPPAKNALRQVLWGSVGEIDANASSRQSSLLLGSSSREPVLYTASLSAAEAEFSTEVDVLMKAIQSRVECPKSCSTSPPPSSAAASTSASASPKSVSISLLPRQPTQQASHDSAVSANVNTPINAKPWPPSPTPETASSQDKAFSGEVSSPKEKRVRKYKCTLPNCGKSFAQKTHLDIHIRAHTGVKPFVSCKDDPRNWTLSSCRDLTSGLTPCDSSGRFAKSKDVANVSHKWAI